MIASPDDVFVELQRDPLNDGEVALVARKVEAYQVELEDLLGRSIEQRPFTEDLHAHRGFVFVSHGPIVSVSSVTFDGIGQTAPGGYRVIGREQVFVAAYEHQLVSITYVGGWPENRLARARDVVVGRAARFLRAASRDAVGIVSEAVQADQLRHQVTYAQPNDEFTPEELRSVENLKLRHVAAY